MSTPEVAPDAPIDTGVGLTISGMSVVISKYADSFSCESLLRFSRVRSDKPLRDWLLKVAKNSATSGVHRRFKERDRRNECAEAPKELAGFEEFRIIAVARHFTPLPTYTWSERLRANVVHREPRVFLVCMVLDWPLSDAHSPSSSPFGCSSPNVPARNWLKCCISKNHASMTSMGAFSSYDANQL